jgi:hypothetical protein
MRLISPSTEASKTSMATFSIVVSFGWSRLSSSYLCFALKAEILFSFELLI